MKRKGKIWLILLLAFFLSGTAAFALTKIRSRERALKPPAALSRQILRPPTILGRILGEELPLVEKMKTGTESALPATSLPETAVKETEKVIRETINTVTETVKESILNNVKIDQEKIVQEVTAKILQSLLSQVGTTVPPASQAVYDACTAIIQKVGTGNSSPGVIK